MNKIFLGVFLFGGCTVSFAMEKVRVLSEDVLLERLQPIQEYTHFIQNSSFIKKIANQSKYPAEIFMVLGFQIEEHNERFKNDKETFCLEMLKPKVVTLILQNYPDAITFLKKENVLAEPVLLPSVLILQDYLNSAGFDHFACNSRVTQELADQQRYPTEIFMIMNLHINEYRRKLNNSPLSALFQQLIPNLTKVILQKHSDAITFLVNEGLLEENK